MHKHLLAIVTVLSLINPAILFARAVAGQSQAVLSRKESTSK
jgi:hypothetical protein